MGFFGFGSTAIRSTVITGQTEGLKGGFKEWVDRWAEREGKGGGYAVFYFAGKRIFFYIFMM